MRISAFLRQHDRYVVVFLLVLFFIISFATKYIDWKIYRIEITKATNNDGGYYKSVADQLVKGSKPVEYLNTFGLRPAFILYLAVLLKIFGYNSDFMISIINMIVISLFLTLLAYMILKRYGPAWYWVSFVAVIIFIAGNPLILFWSPFILTDTLAMAVLILGMFIYLNVTHKLKYLFLGIVYALAFHMREVTFINFVALIVTMFILRESKKNMGVFLLTYLIVIVPWLLYILMNTTVSPLNSHLISAVAAREGMAHTGGLSFLNKFLKNISRHYFLYITDGGAIDHHGYYSIVYTLAMYVMGLLGAIVIYIKHCKKEFLLITISIILTAIFYGFVGEGPYMRGRVLVEYLLMYIAAIGFIFSMQSIRESLQTFRGVGHAQGIINKSS